VAVLETERLLPSRNVTVAVHVWVPTGGSYREVRSFMASPHHPLGDDKRMPSQGCLEPSWK
jgi:hypothetical protein